MKKILFFFISLCGVMQAQITLSHESGIVPYGTEITITAPLPTDTIWYAWDGHNPFSVYGQYIVGSGTMIIPEPDEGAPYWSRFHTGPQTEGALFPWFVEWYIIDSLSAFQNIASVLKTNVLRISANGHESTFFYVDPITLNRHAQIPIVHLAFEESDLFGNQGIMVQGDCAPDPICGESTFFSPESVYEILPLAEMDHNITQDRIIFYNFFMEESARVDSALYVFQDTVIIMHVYDTTYQTSYVVTLHGSIEVINDTAYVSADGIEFSFTGCASFDFYNNNMECLPYFAIRHEPFEQYPHLLDRNIIFKKGAMFLHDDGYFWNGEVEMRIMGASSRIDPAKSMRIKVPKENPIRHDFFHNNKDYYRTFSLRKWGSNKMFMPIADWLAHTLLEGYPVPLGHQLGKPTMVYLNGEYWGLYLLQERADKYYPQLHYGVDDDRVVRFRWEYHHPHGMVPLGLYGEAYNEIIPLLGLRSYIDTADLSNPDHVDRLESFIDITNFFTSQNYSAGLARTDWGGNNRLWLDTDEGILREMIKDYDLMFDPAEIHINHFRQYLYDPVYEPDVYYGGKMQAWLIQTLYTHDTLRWRGIHTMSDLRTLVIHPDTLTYYVQLLSDSLLPHLDINRERWSHVHAKEPDQSQWVSHGYQKMIEFASARPGYIDQFFIEDFPEITGTTNMYFSMTLDDPLCPFEPAHNQAFISTVPTLGYDAPRWRHTFDIPTPLSATGDLAYWLVNSDTIFESSPWIDIDANIEYHITAVFTCPTIDPNIGNIVINEIVSSNQHIVTNHPQGKFEDYIEL
ncbi:MAG: CotH kinase family protein, partial [Candidatus Pacebacteria bacterium]|nr:CotH kinase family protein [Candidatus Paceibacterota bacterium]